MHDFMAHREVSYDERHFEILAIGTDLGIEKTLHYDVFEKAVGGGYKDVYTKQITIGPYDSYSLRVNDLVERLQTKPEDFFGIKHV